MPFLSHGHQSRLAVEDESATQQGVPIWRDFGGAASGTGAHMHTWNIWGTWVNLRNIWGFGLARCLAMMLKQFELGYIKREA